MAEELTDEELRELTRRKRREIWQSQEKPERVGKMVGPALRGMQGRRRKGSGIKKDKNKRELPKGKFTRITNEFIEAVYRQYLRPNESKVLWFLVRKTWGWGKKSDFIALKQFSQELGIGKNKISEALSALRKRRIVDQLGNKTYGIQRDTSLWRNKPKKKRVRKRVENC